MIMIVIVRKSLACHASGSCYRLVARHVPVDAEGNMAFADLMTLI